MNINGNLILNAIYPIGSLYFSTVSTKPDLFLGGNWEAFAKGRTLVGIDTSQTEFNTVLKEGGATTHTLTIDEMPSHWHDNYNATGTGSDYAIQFRQVGARGGQTWVTSMNNGGSQPHNNLQPYVVIYIWKRIA